MMNFSIADFLMFLFFAAMVFFVCVYVAAWLWDFLSQWKSGFSRWICRICGMRFYVRKGQVSQECPHCGTLNSGRKRFRR